MEQLIDLLRGELFVITATVLVYWGARYLQRVTRLAILNPMVISIAVLIILLKVSAIPYETYQEGAHLIEFWLKPAIVALGYPLYKELSHIRRQFAVIFITELVGCIVGIISVVLIAQWLGASDEVIASLAPKSVSTPIAIEISSQIGGIPALSSAIVVVVGLIGAMLGLKMMDWGHVHSPVSKSLGMGTAAHVLGTNRIGEYGERYGAYATLALILNGILTAFLAGPLLHVLLI